MKNKPIYSKSMKNKVTTELENLKISSKAGYRIYYNGDLLVMNSGKFVWNKSGKAKNALIGSLKYTLGWDDYHKAKTYEVLEELINLGTIKIEYYEGI